jgi:3-phenylpropionate/trans-cinnamate dioxygenase ferredoxin subunit
VSDWHDLGSVEEVERVGHVVARVRNREVGVVRDPLTGSLYGVRNRCPHHGAPLCLGTVRERVGGAPGRYELAGRRVLRCPWHGWEFDLATGACLDDPAARAAVYPVRVDAGRVLVRA